jgi:heme/copper-type cytochrome/quinol oxidase subunit 2
VAISFAIVGSIWGIGNLISQNNSNNTTTVKQTGLTLIAQDDRFNKTNPDIYVKKGMPLRINILNKDFRRHDFVINELNLNTGYMSTDQQVTLAIASNSKGTFEYYCSLHPDKMRGKVIIEN